MTERIIAVSEPGAFLKARNTLLVIERKNSEPKEVTVPFSETAVLLLENRAITITGAALAGMADAGGGVVICGERHLPCGMLLPLSNHSVQTERFIRQAEVSEPVKKSAWQTIVKSKLKNQAELLMLTKNDDGGIRAIIRKVRSGDPDNIEARAARIYWQSLFGSDDVFFRDRFAADQNRMLNYGYAVLRAMVARAVCAVGLHPTLGINHHNKYNPFCFADDLMEPFRPIVDRAVFAIVSTFGAETEMKKEIKQMLLEPLLGKVILNKQQVSLFYALSRAASSWVECIFGKVDTLLLPDSIFI